MIRRLCVLVCVCFALPAFVAHADSAVTLRSRIEATGAAVTLGDVFNGAGDVASRPIAPAPPAGQVTSLSAAFLSAAAASAGLSWAPPAGVDSVQVTHPAGARALVAATAPAGASVADAAVHRGDTALISFAAPGIQLSTHARALTDGGVGDTVRFLNPSSNRTIEAVVTGPGAARVDSP